MIQKIALGLFLFITVAVLALLGLASTKPATYRVERSIVTTAAAPAVFGYLEDLHKFPEWSPWQELDPAMKVEHSGAEKGAGASYFWSGNDKVGEGRMTITESIPADHVSIKLEFLKPFASTSDTKWNLTPEGDGTKITWSMDGTNSFMGKVMCVFMDMDKMIGADFERGLAKLKQVAESAPPPAAEPAAADTTQTAATH
jgi:uncharacterized protein YndB with AHSA1/START domain